MAIMAHSSTVLEKKSALNEKKTKIKLLKIKKTIIPVTPNRATENTRLY